MTLLKVFSPFFIWLLGFAIFPCTVKRRYREAQVQALAHNLTKETDSGKWPKME